MMSKQTGYFHWSVDTDEGWQVDRTWDRFLIYKGYTEEGQLPNRVREIADEPWASIKGNFCILDIQESGIRVIHNECRSFPLWYDDKQGLTNLVPLTHSVWADSSVHIDQDLELTEIKHDIIGDLPQSTALVSYVLDTIDDILITKLYWLNILSLTSFGYAIIIDSQNRTGHTNKYIIGVNQLF